MQHILLNKDFAVKAINVSAYGASLVYIDEDGRPLTHLYNYLKPYPPVLQKQFFKTFGPEDEFCRQTASPRLGSLNSGLQLYRLKYEQPLVFTKTKYAMHLPQFISWRLCGNAVSDITSIGCHTALWDFDNNTYHDWVYNEEVVSRLAPLTGTATATPLIVNNQQIMVGTGLHDSSAALIPYLQQFTEPFVLISTGTWSISLNPFNTSPLTTEELKQDCLCYLSYKGKPVKAARLFLGNIHDEALKKISSHFHVTPDFYKFLQPDVLMLKNSSTQTLETDSAFPEPADYKNCSEAYHGLIIKLVALQKKSTDLVLNDATSHIYVDGGFAGNPFFMQLMAAAYPNKQVAAASTAQGTALGAALAMHEQWNKKTIAKKLVNTQMLLAG
jgi:sugar (pentulose or hexulose) kinase